MDFYLEAAKSKFWRRLSVCDRRMNGGGVGVGGGWVGAGAAAPPTITLGGGDIFSPPNFLQHNGTTILKFM